MNTKQKYAITIEETSALTVVVRADSQEEAIEKVEAACNEGTIELTADNFVSRDVHTCSAHTDGIIPEDEECYYQELKTEERVPVYLSILSRSFEPEMDMKKVISRLQERYSFKSTKTEVLPSLDKLCPIRMFYGTVPLEQSYLFYRAEDNTEWLRKDTTFCYNWIVHTGYMPQTSGVPVSMYFKGISHDPFIDRMKLSENLAENYSEFGLELVDDRSNEGNFVLLFHGYCHPRDFEKFSELNHNTDQICKGTTFEQVIVSCGQVCEEV